MPAGNLFCFEIGFNTAFCQCDGRMREEYIQTHAYIQIYKRTHTHTSTHSLMSTYIHLCKEMIMLSFVSFMFSSLNLIPVVVKALS